MTSDLTAKQPNDTTTRDINGWDDTDHAIYDCRIRRRMSLRATGNEVGLAHTTVSDRLRKMMRRATHAEVDEMRTTEGHKLDELEATNWALAEAAATVAEFDAALRALREVHAIARTRADLFGLHQPTAREITDDYLAGLLNAYLTGVNDTASDQVP